MEYTGYEILWLFFVYSFLGWVLETASAAFRQKQFVNRGLVNAPLCVIYGITAAVMTVFFGELHGVWLFAAGFIISTLIEWIAGHAIERMYHERWWNYSKLKWNLDGYICLPVSVCWGLLIVAAMEWGNPLFVKIYSLIPALPGKILVLVLLAVLIIDIAATLCILSGRSRRMEQWEEVDSWLSGISSRLGRWIYGFTDRRIRRAYPDIVHRKKEEAAVGQRVFAAGCGFYKLFWLLIIGAFLGDIVETLFCRMKMGIWMSRSSLVWGPFSLVWGVAIAAASLLLYKYRDRSDRFLFLAGTFLGGAYEYICSVLSELVFGKVFWDYSKMMFNLGGRINLLYCFFWGIAAVVWMKGLYPVFSRWIEKIPVKIGKILTWILVVFFVVNMAVSSLALIRSNQRSDQIPATHQWQKIMDEHFGDAKLKKIYPNAIEVD
ncbi:hypothetical protein B5E53_05395 [Eubacterium sp. An11]|uniref:putative ABC transporter permease n=1 Tax=Eubacterium sp. An11 TaxID=1965542 RepID=UPI000B3A28AB|nr:putative ABC transporter permease [Eubacterium sp. An11]OUQ68957.1 hypothetical protein B5E53_05395 [Eubacterium sp. An11]